ncbi:MAG: hypothetical protein ABI426_06960 [Flavobacterium sp.]
MKNILSIIIFLTLFICCKKERKDCKNAELENKIIISNWGTDNMKNSDIKLYAYDTSYTKKIDSFEIDKVTVFNDKKAVADYFGSMEIILNKPLLSKDNYRLILFDSLKYDISNIEILTETVMIGMREKKECLVNSFKINGSVVENHTSDAKIVFRK